MRIGIRKQSVIYSWLISYMVILIIPILTSVFSYILSAGTIRREITNTNEYMLQQIGQDIDSLIRDMDKTFQYYITNDAVRSLMNAPDSEMKNQTYLVNQFFSDKSKPAESDFYNGYLYLKRLEFVLDTCSKYDLDIAYEAMEVNGGDTYEQWLEMLNGVTERTIRQQSDGSICFLYPVYNSKFVNSTAVYVAQLKQDYTEKLRQRLAGLNKAWFAILTPENTVAITNGRALELPFAYGEVPTGAGIADMRAHGTNDVVMYRMSEAAELKYVISIPQSVFFQKANNILLVIVIQVILSVLLGIYISFLFAKKNYTPVGEILQMVGGGEAQVDNEFEFIRRAVLDKIEEIKDAEHKMWKNKDIVFNNMVRKLLAGGMNKVSEFEAFLEEYDITPACSRYAVLMVKVEDYSEMFAGEAETENAESSLYIVKVALTNIIKELSAEQYVSMVTDLEDMIVCILNLEDADGVEVLASNMQSMIKTYLRVEVSISVSNAHKDFLSIPDCYKEASEAMEYRAVLGVGNIIRFSEISATDEWYQFTVDQEIRIINSVKAGDFERAEAVIQEVLDEERLRSMPVELCKCLMFDLVSTVMRAINAAEEFSGNRGAIWNTLSPTESLLSCQSVVEMKAVVTELLEKVCAYISEQKNSRVTKLRDDITNYVERNFADQNLNVNMIAEAFGKNPTYLSRYFKEQTNVGLLDFINQVRIRHAKELIQKNATMTVQEVVEKVGFLNSAALIRVFKKYEGITPGQFKNAVQAEKREGRQ